MNDNASYSPEHSACGVFVEQSDVSGLNKATQLEVTLESKEATVMRPCQDLFGFT